MGGSQENYSTPQDLWDELDAEFKFVLDACASPENAKCELYFTKEDNALTKDWYPYKRVWMNPPYDTRDNHKNLLMWVGKAHSEAGKHCLVVCLLPSKTDTEWWHRYAGDGEKRFIRGRLHFNNLDRAPFPSVILIFSTWRILVRRTLRLMGGVGSVGDLFTSVMNSVAFSGNRFVREKIRQTLQRYPEFKRVNCGVWQLRGV